MEFIAFPIGHAGTILVKTLEHCCASILTADQGVDVHGSRDVGMSYWYARIGTL